MAAFRTDRQSLFHCTPARRAIALSSVRDEPDDAENDVDERPQENDEKDSNAGADSCC